jgi:hypothetical protein
MIDLNEALNLFATAIGDGTGLRVTTDPATVIPPVVFIDLPAVTGRTMGAVTLNVPVYLVAEGSADQIAGTYLLAHLPAFLDATSTAVANPRPLDVGGQQWPAYTVQATLTVKESTP